MNVGHGEENLTALSHNTVFMGIQQLATLAVHKRFFVGDHVLPVAIRFEECFCPGDVIAPNLRAPINVGGCCPCERISRSVSLNVAPNVLLRLRLSGEEGTMNFTPVSDKLLMRQIASTHHENT